MMRRLRPASSFPPSSLQGKLLLFAALLVILPGLLFGAIVQRSSHASLQEMIGQAAASSLGGSTVDTH